MKRILTIAATLLLSTGMAMAAASIELNSATKEQLVTVKGIGPAHAKEIIAYRTKNGPFASVDALTKAGLSQSLVNTLKADNAVTVAPTTTATNTPAADSATAPAATAAATPTDNGATKAPATTATTTTTNTTMMPAAAARTPNTPADKMAPSLATPSSTTTTMQHSTTAAPAAPAATAPNAQ